MRYLFPLTCALVAAIGLLFGALNPAATAIDFYWFQTHSSLGAALLCAGLAGALLAGLCLWLAVILPQGRRLRRASRALGTVGTAAASATSDKAAE